MRIVAGKIVYLLLISFEFVMQPYFEQTYKKCFNVISDYMSSKYLKVRGRKPLKMCFFFSENHKELLQFYILV